ncbi:MAG: hypothetical protein ACYCWW_07920 [Deltaproteobacteria bacterium]
MKPSELLQVRVNDELVLDAGSWEEISGPRGPERLVRPPSTTLFAQVLTYLREKPDPPRCPSGSMVGREGVAAAALTLRWGSYLAVLLDHDKPAWPESHSTRTSRISDEEMARINIESSAALAAWIDVYRSERGGHVYEQLVNRAVAYLPMPRKTSRLKVTEVGALAEPRLASQLIEAFRASRASDLDQVRADVERHPSRVLANALVNTAWRNGPVENIHAGSPLGYPLDQRRMTPAEERELMAFASERLAQGMSLCLRFALEQPPRPWTEQVLPYGLAEMMLITPSRWTLTETSREVRLSARVAVP